LDQIILEEYKIIKEEKNFYVTKFFNAAALYLAIMGLTFKLFFEMENKSIMLLIFIEIINTIALFTAYKFKKLILFIIDREILLAKELAFEKSYSIIWGYNSGLIMIVLISIIFLFTYLMS